ncbi:methionine ABC transporter ATP-binding protein [Anaerocolumna aminovalerica]|uniref:D-methionine transport system ATP-binding protein n=1 Tax=Anaerocolumna aminovalerica TaxID=1527 RepID=A0A1I5BHB0_9FIRM|nr:ATP-binding cassette domain-containing protein [Anaerocolumna aminovalerica]SFN74124.1 D-methionine transport system ATP-binding protein [Anaerocolumna aminovalerica]
MEGIIEVRNLTKTFQDKNNKVEALKDINLSIHKGEIFGIIGMSGAGKSTLVRCLNFLEKPTSGIVSVDGKDLSKLTAKELRNKRMEISMIFQHFNLLMQKSVLDNICFPLSIAGVNKKEARDRALELLKIVGMEEKAGAYPSQLSGGQKQRVAIARALANNPKILLCDEATSALDPQTTKSILELLKNINEEYGITIVIITHEMAVVREICSHVAIISNGTLAEAGKVIDIFTSPKTKAAKDLILHGDENISNELTDTYKDATIKLMKTKRCIRIVFSENSSFEPVIANMVLEHKAPVNILKADTKNIGGIARGEMILGLPEDEDTASRMIAYLKGRGLAVEEVSDYVD